MTSHGAAIVDKEGAALWVERSRSRASGPESGSKASRAAVQPRERPPTSRT